MASLLCIRYINTGWDFFALTIANLNHEVGTDFGLHVSSRSCLGYWW